MLSGTFFPLSHSYRLIVADIDGALVFVEIWARSDKDLATWMPTANALLESVQFTEGAATSSAR